MLSELLCTVLYITTIHSHMFLCHSASFTSFKMGQFAFVLWLVLHVCLCLVCECFANCEFVCPYHSKTSAVDCREQGLWNGEQSQRLLPQLLRHWSI